MKNHTEQLIEQNDRGYYIKLCKGCRTYEEGMEALTEDERKEIVYLCNISVPLKGDETCPCSDCIVKMLCDTKCELLEKYIPHISVTVGDRKS